MSFPHRLINYKMHKRQNNYLLIAIIKNIALPADNAILFSPLSRYK